MKSVTTSEPNVRLPLPLGGAERAALITELTVMVRSMANRLSARLPRHIDVDDLMSAGMIGLFDALAKFEQAHATDIRKYATVRIKGAILDELRAQDPLSRSTRKKARELDRSTHGLEQALGRVPSDHEVARHLGMGIDGYLALRAAVQPVRFASVEQVVEEGGDVSSWLTDRPGISAHEMLEGKDLRSLIDRELKGLASRRHEHVLRFCFFDDMTNREIAKVLGVSESRASQLLSESLAVFARRLRAALRMDFEVHERPTPGRSPSARGVRWQLPARSDGAPR